MRFKKAAFVLLALLYLCGGKARAQSTTGTIRGHVNDAQGLPLPGVTVSVASPNLQGTRTAVTAENGDFVITVLPSGTYTVTFELSGFQRVSQTVGLAPTQDLPIKVELGPATVTEELTVVATEHRQLLARWIVGSTVAETRRKGPGRQQTFPGRRSRES